MSWFKTKKTPHQLTTQDKLKQSMELIQQLDRTEYKRFMEGADLINQGWNKAFKVQTREEKEDKDIDQAFEETQ